MIFVLTGIKHSGKSTIGKKWADSLQFDFLDTDKIIESRSGGMSCRNIFRTRGQDYFMQEEHTVLTVILNQNQERHLIIALGGGVADNTPSVEYLMDEARTQYLTTVYLYEKEEILYKRIMDGGIPPFLDGDDPKHAFHQLYQRRDRIYRQISRYTIPVHTKTPAEIVKELNEHTGAGSVGE